MTDHRTKIETSLNAFAAALFSGRDGKLPSAQDIPASSADLELITWLVIVGGKA